MSGMVRLERGIECPASKFSVQHAERVGVVDVVPRCKHMYVQPQLARPIDRLLCDPAGAPGDILEQARMSLLDAEEVVASVDGRAEHGVIAGLCEKLRRFDQQPGRQGVWVCI